MKIIEVIPKPSLQDGFLFRIVPDSVLLRNNESFYYPNFSKRIGVNVGIAIKIKKIGKAVFPKFVDKYFEELGIAFHFTAIDLSDELLANNMSNSISYGFDKSLAISKFSKNTVDTFQKNMQIFFNDTDFFMNTLVFEDVKNAISKASGYFTLKIGDLFYVNCGYVGDVAIGDNLKVLQNGDLMLTCDVK